MRPSLMFIGLFLVLMLIYRGLAGTVGPGATFAIQAVLVVALVAALTWWRRQGAASDGIGGSTKSDPHPHTESPRQLTASQDESAPDRTTQQPDQDTAPDPGPTNAEKDER